MGLIGNDLIKYLLENIPYSRKTSQKREQHDTMAYFPHSRVQKREGKPQDSTLKNCIQNKGKKEGLHGTDAGLFGKEFFSHGGDEKTGVLLPRRQGLVHHQGAAYASKSGVASVCGATLCL